MISQPELAHYHHQSLWSPPTSTVIKSINNGQLRSFPGLLAKIMTKLPPSTATAKGHMHRQRQGLRSTSANLPEPNLSQAQPSLAFEELDMNPPLEANASVEKDLFCFAALSDSITGTIYTDLPGRFPVISISNMQYIFVCYAYESNAILVCPMKSRSDACF